MTGIQLRGVSKTYAVYKHGFERLLEIITGRSYHKKFIALQSLDLDIESGEVVGIIGMNGAGKTTLLKLLAGTLAPSTGSISIKGRVGALLELGTGFHPEMTGRENVYLAAAVMGLPKSVADVLYPEIVEFSGLAAFMDQPVKTYSSGMFVRLAFAVATSIDPDVLIIDEALSVGDGAFARKSFDRIMGFKKLGKTILFCSHSLYQIEAICSRVIWIHQGRIMLDGNPAQVTAAYNAFLSATSTKEKKQILNDVPASARSDVTAIKGYARLTRVRVSAGSNPSTVLDIVTGESNLHIAVEFDSDPEMSSPTVAVAIAGSDGRFVCSAGTYNDGVFVERGGDGRGSVQLTFPRLPLLKGNYWLHVFLLCERAIHVYDSAESVAELRVRQHDLQQGIVSLPHYWNVAMP